MQDVGANAFVFASMLAPSVRTSHGLGQNQQQNQPASLSAHLGATRPNRPGDKQPKQGSTPSRRMEASGKLAKSHARPPYMPLSRHERRRQQQQQQQQQQPRPAIPSVQPPKSGRSAGGPQRTNEPSAEAMAFALPVPSPSSAISSMPRSAIHTTAADGGNGPLHNRQAMHRDQKTFMNSCGVLSSNPQGLPSPEEMPPLGPMNIADIAPAAEAASVPHHTCDPSRTYGKQCNFMPTRLPMQTPAPMDFMQQQLQQQQPMMWQQRTNGVY
ncbi:hypothetical protein CAUPRSCDRAFT_11639 [Caulochytrium protostelioides]|uniref:Uncharacterized protein n=1 Tax=Caulochytrium protostelioides TaxID=1555241 RepID=A0A4P9WWF0_9FUNG|nr:hypothetical protein CAUPRSCDRAFT_11639 [Caulochytrium protostelioides]